MRTLMDMLRWLMIGALIVLGGMAAGFFILGTVANLAGLAGLFLGAVLWPNDPALWALACYGAFFAFSFLTNKTNSLMTKLK